MADQELHPRRLQIDHVHSRVKRCRSVKDRSRLWKVGVRDRVRDICCAPIMPGSSSPWAADDLIEINSNKGRSPQQATCVRTVGFEGVTKGQRVAVML
jgi:hypothetical protein